MTIGATAHGMILGTAAYMAPEQARGRPVDRRADIWAFGVILFEMLAGRQLFGGETTGDVLAAVLTGEIDWSALPATTPAMVRRLLRRCLERDPRRRLQAIGEARVGLEDPAALDENAALDEEVAPSASGRSGRARAAALAGGLALFAAGWWLRPTPPVAAPPVRMLDVGVTDLETVLGLAPAISPDGARVVYARAGHLWIRQLDQADDRQLPDSADAQYPCWSPDGKALAFARDGRAWRTSPDGGEATDLGAVPTDLVGSGGCTWTADGRVVFAGSDTVGLWAVPAAGGAGHEILPIDRHAESDFHEISELPGGRGLIFTVHRRNEPPDTIGLSAGHTWRAVLSMTGESLRHPIYSPTGHIVFERQTTSPGIWAVPFSLDRLQATGEPFLVVANGASPTLARDDTLCFVRPDDRTVELVRISRAGVAETVAKLAGTRSSMLTHVPASTGFQAGGGVSLAPDGRRVALSFGYAPGQLLLFDLDRGSLSSVASGIFPSRAVWAARGERLVYASAHDARAWNLAWRRADAAGEEQRLSTSDEVQVPLALSPDGAHLVFVEGSGANGALAVMPPAPGAAASPLFARAVWGLGASFSPDGRWLAYDSVESGRAQVSVRPFPGGDQRFQLSTDGGEAPVWARDGEVFYLAGGAIWAVSVAPHGDGLDIAKPVQLFHTGGDTHLAAPFDVTPDGQTFYMLRIAGSDNLSLILHWSGELARRAALGGSHAPH